MEALFQLPEPKDKKGNAADTQNIRLLSAMRPSYASLVLLLRMATNRLVVNIQKTYFLRTISAQMGLKSTFFLRRKSAQMLQFWAT